MARISLILTISFLIYTITTLIVSANPIPSRLTVISPPVVFTLNKNVENEDESSSSSDPSSLNATKQDPKNFFDPQWWNDFFGWKNDGSVKPPKDGDSGASGGGDEPTWNPDNGDNGGWDSDGDGWPWDGETWPWDDSGSGSGGDWPPGSGEESRDQSTGLTKLHIGLIAGGSALFVLIAGIFAGVLICRHRKRKNARNRLNREGTGGSTISTDETAVKPVGKTGERRQGLNPNTSGTPIAEIEMPDVYGNLNRLYSDPIQQQQQQQQGQQQNDDGYDNVPSVSRNGGESIAPPSYFA